MRSSMLTSWLMGNESITPRNFFEKSIIDLQLGIFLSLDEYVELYKACDFDSGNLEESWIATRSYIKKAFSLINEDIDEILATGYENNSLDNEEKYTILNTLGNPPLCSYNIYMVTIYNEDDERLVYIGKTNSKKSRFINGHSVALKLHNPKYSKYKKRVYFGTLVFLDKNKQYKPLEYVFPIEDAKKLLDYCESMLIRHFKPELNKQLVNSEKYIPSMNLHIQNFTDTSPFMNDIFVSN